MQIDAHMDFSENYDSLMMEAWAKVDNEYAILSSYVNDMNTMELHGLQALTLVVIIQLKLTDTMGLQIRLHEH